MKWRDITLKQYQSIEAITQNEDYDELDKQLYAACVVFDITERQMNATNPKKVARMISRTRKLLAQPFPKVPPKRIGFYLLNYNADTWQLAQFIELMHFLKQPQENAHLIVASIATLPFTTYNSDHHRRKADKFLRAPITKVAAAVGLVQEVMSDFNKRFPDLFELPLEDDELIDESEEPQREQIPVSRFDEDWGWIYAAKQVATFEGIPMSEVYKLPAREALVTLTYLKAEREHEKQLLKNATN